jgi:His/Glu/Gln/Arg/opine family amino acid ABC transporter permease subunit
MPPKTKAVAFLKIKMLLGKAIPLFEKYDDHYFLGNAYLLMGQLFLDIDYREPVAEQIELSRKSYERAGYPLNRIYFFEAMARNDDSSLALYQRSIAVGGKDWAMSLQALVSISDYFLARQMPDSAEAYCRRAYDMLRRHDPENQFFYSLLAVGQVKACYQQGRYAEALDVLHTLEPFARQLKGERMMCDVYEYLWKVNDQLGNRDEAYRYLNRYQQEYERTGAEIRSSDIPKAQARDAIARQQDHIRLLEQEAQLARTRLYTTLLVTLFALLLGVVLGVLVALVRTAHDQQRPGKRNPVLGFFNAVTKVYVTVIRGTPMMVQLLIMGFVIFASSRDYVTVGALTLGINSGAYTAEIIRGGLMAVDPGQMEAGRSLGMNYTDTMRFVVIPQAIKAILPSLGNEFIVLLKDTSLISVIGGKELLYAARGVVSRTYEAMYPYIGTAIIYLILVMGFTWLLGIFERRLRESDRR